MDTFPTALQRLQAGQEKGLVVCEWAMGEEVAWRLCRCLRDTCQPVPSSNHQPPAQQNSRPNAAQTNTCTSAAKEAWERLFGLIEEPDQAHQALELMQADARVRDAASWDWGAQGYGQTVMQLVTVSGAAGAVRSGP